MTHPKLVKSPLVNPPSGESWTLAALGGAFVSVLGLSIAYVSRSELSLVRTCLSRGSELWSRVREGMKSLDISLCLGGSWLFFRQMQSHVVFSTSTSTSTTVGRKQSVSDACFSFLADFLFLSLLMNLRTTGKPDEDPHLNQPGVDSAKGGNEPPLSLPPPSLTTSIPTPTEAATSAADTHTQQFLATIERNLGLASSHDPKTLASSDPGSSPRREIHRAPLPPAQPQRFLEVLVHNVSHTDLILSLDVPPLSERDSMSGGVGDEYCLCRPRFSAFDGYSRRVLSSLSEEENGSSLHQKLISFPRHQRSGQNNRVIQLETDEALDQLPIGFSLDKAVAVTPQELNDLRVRGRDAPRVVGRNTDTPLNAVFFPLLAMLLPQWHARLEEKYAPTANTKKVLILVSGVGNPRNWTHSRNGNSTQYCAQLMERFVHTLYPDWVVVQVFSNTNIFRYDENISFVQKEFIPCIQSYRDAHAKGKKYPDELVAGNRFSDSDDIPFDPDWHKTMNVTLSFADGSPARSHAIQAALRPYKPTYFHCWQLKTFWHESKIVDSDIEVHSFEEMETLPPLDTSSKEIMDNKMVAKVVEEMKEFKVEMERILRSGSHDIRTFWLRKTHKAVLAVLAVQSPNGGGIKLYRGTNMEVSMPTGSLCAERNVIGTALADNPGLKRHHLKLIAVLSVPNPSSLSRPASTTSLNTMVSARQSRSNSLEVQEYHNQNHLFKPPRPPSRSNSMDIGEWVLQEGVGTQSTLPGLSLAHSDSIVDPADSVGQADGTISPGAPARRISLFQYPGGQSNTHESDTITEKKSKSSLDASSYRYKMGKKMVVVHSQEDLNPLRPCGACNEWLKKIAETNPYFQILTFTDAECNGVYCTPCSE